MTQAPGDLWSRLRRPLLEPESRFAWSEPIFRALRLRIAGQEQPLDELFARILFNDAERRALAVGFSERPLDRMGCDVVIKLEQLAEATRVEAALSGRSAKELELDGQRLAEYPGIGEQPPGVASGPLPGAGVIHLPPQQGSSESGGRLS
jgi:hypothetical protein